VLEIRGALFILLTLLSPAVACSQTQVTDQANPLDYVQQTPASQSIRLPRSHLTTPQSRCQGRIRLPRIKKTIPRASRPSVCSGLFPTLQR